MAYESEGNSRDTRKVGKPLVVQYATLILAGEVGVCEAAMAF